MNKHSDAQVKPSENPGPRPALDWIDKKLIDVDRRYQRDISAQGTRHVNGILRDFEWKYFQVVTVTPTKGGRYNAIDGQHRLLAALRHPAITDIPCVVLHKIDLQEQASVFTTMNGTRLGVTNLARFHASVAAGDADANKVDYICEEAGLTILKVPPQGSLPPLSLICVGKLLFYRRRSDMFMISVLSAMAKAWPDRINGFRAPNVSATVDCATKLASEYDRSKMVTVLRRWNEHEEYLRAYTERSERGGTVAKILARRMEERYRGQ